MSPARLSTQPEPGTGAGESKQDVSLEAGGSLRLRLGLTRREDEETLQLRGAQNEGKNFDFPDIERPLYNIVTQSRFVSMSNVYLLFYSYIQLICKN